MKSELKRALLKKSNLVLIIAVVSLMLINAYYNGWETALKVDSAQDILNNEDKIFYKKYFGNMYRVWVDSYYLVQALAPVILVAPYLNTYLLEKKNRFRFFCVSRKGNLKYVIQKAFAIALSGTIILAFSEMVLAIVTGLFLVFAIGVTSFLQNKIAVIVAPFIIVGVLDFVLPTALQPNVVMRPYLSTFSIGGYGILISIYVIVGSILLMVAEKLYQKRGN